MFHVLKLNLFKVGFQSICISWVVCSCLRSLWHKHWLSVKLELKVEKLQNWKLIFQSQSLFKVGWELHHRPLSYFLLTSHLTNWPLPSSTSFLTLLDSFPYSPERTPSQPPLQLARWPATLWYSLFSSNGLLLYFQPFHFLPTRPRNVCWIFCVVWDPSD